MNEDLKKLKERLKNFDEANLARVWQMTEDPRYIFAILTAFRNNDESSPEENHDRNTRLRWDIRDARLGFWEIKGYYVETLSNGEQRKVEEESYFVSLPAVKKGDNPEKRLKNFVINALKKYDQQQAVVKLSDGNTYLIDQGGTLEDIGKFSPGKIVDCYSRLHNGRTFVFESTITRSWVRAIANDKIKKLEAEEERNR